MKLEKDTLKHPFDLPAIVLVVAVDLADPDEPRLAHSEWKKNRRTALSEARRSVRHEINHKSLSFLRETGGTLRGISVMTDGSCRELFVHTFGGVEPDTETTELEMSLIEDWINSGGDQLMIHKAEKLDQARRKADQLDELGD
jgi:hypothetical protein